MSQVLLLLTGLAALCAVSFGKLPGLNAEERLLHDLLDSYDPILRLTRPVKNPKDTIKVQFGLSLIKTNKLNEDTGDAEFVFWDKYAWNDSRLMWDPAQYGDIDNVRILPKYIWTPDIVGYNGFHMNQEPLEDIMVVVSHNGNVLYIPPHIRHADCSVNEAAFKKEFQCEFKVGSWTYSGLQLDIDFYNNQAKIDTADYAQSNKYTIASTSAKKNVVKYACCPEPYPNLTFKLKLVKKN